MLNFFRIAYIDLKDDGINKALELSGSEIGGRNIMVNVDRPRVESGDANQGKRGRGMDSRSPFNRGRGRDNRGRGRDNRGRGRSSFGTPSKPSLLATSQGLFLPLLSSPLPLDSLVPCIIFSHKLAFVFVLAGKKIVFDDE